MGEEENRPAFTGDPDLGSWFKARKNPHYDQNKTYLEILEPGVFVPADSKAQNSFLEGGHLAPRGDFSRHKKDETVTFLTTNIVPQDLKLNRGAWEDLEGDLRTEVGKGKNYHIIAGVSGTNSELQEVERDPDTGSPLKDNNGVFIGTGNPKEYIEAIGNTEEQERINVPAYFWKVIAEVPDLDSPIEEAQDPFAVWIPNKRLPNSKNDWEDYIISIPDLEKELNKTSAFQYDFFPDSASLLASSDANFDDLTISNTSIGHDGIVESNKDEIRAGIVSPFEVDISEPSIIPPSFANISPSEVGSIKLGGTEIGILKMGSSKVGTSKIGTSQSSLKKVSIPQVGISEIGIADRMLIQPNSSQVSPTQVNPIQTTDKFEGSISKGSPTQIDSFEIKPFVGSGSRLERGVRIDDSKLSEVSFPSSITFEQIWNRKPYSFHNSSPEIINDLNNTATNIWSDLLQSETQLDINFQITDLPKGQLAEATITGFDDSGKPNAGTIAIDHDANGVSWFIDSTPLDNSEFNAQDTDSYLLATAESEADGKYDLLTTALHELAHLYGFIDGYAGFDANIETENGTTKFIGDDFEAILDGEHLDKIAHPGDLMNTHLAPGIRKLPSEVDVQILQAILSESTEIPLNPPYEGGLDASLAKGGAEGGGIELPTASLTSEPLLAIANRDFEISDTTTNSFAWDTRGASGVENGQAVLTEDSPFLSNFTQTFTIPEEAKTLQLKLVETELGATDFAPPDAFEVALLDANTNQSLTSDSGLTETDSLLNIQNDGLSEHGGKAYFSDRVRIGGATSGDIIDLNKSRTVTVDIFHLAAGTEATLYFDLLGFGDVDSRVVIDDVRLSDQNLLTPVAVGDTATTTQGQPVTINILANDTDDDGEIATNSVQIQTEPSNGFVIPRDDGMVSYIPDTGFAGTDGFTYVVQDNDGQFSEPATVEVTVANVAPEISEIQIPDNVIEGTEITLNAIASDTGNDQLTYSWQFKDGTANFSATASDPGDDTLTYTWDFGDDSGIIEGADATHTFTDNGNYAVTLTVRDEDGGETTQTLEVL